MTTKETKTDGWQTHSTKHKRIYFAVMVNEFWVIVNQCECGSFHSYVVLSKDKEPSLGLKRKTLEELPKEFRDHLLIKAAEAKLVSPPSPSQALVPVKK